MKRGQKVESMPSYVCEKETVRTYLESLGHPKDRLEPLFQNCDRKATKIGHLWWKDSEGRDKKSSRAFYLCAKCSAEIEPFRGSRGE
jgi:hypothetical protein